MKNITLFQVLNFSSSALTAILIVSPFIYQAIPNLPFSIPGLYAYAIVTIISWVLCMCAIDVNVANGGYEE
jgi:hypothetical protein